MKLVSDQWKTAFVCIQGQCEPGQCQAIRLIIGNLIEIVS